MLCSLILPDGMKCGLGPTNVLGRSSSCTIVLAGHNVSRRHAHIYESNGDFQIVDTQSNNGTYVNDVRIVHPARLKHGDIIRIGDNNLRFVFAAQAAQDDDLARDVSEPPTTLAIREVSCWLLLIDIRESSKLTHELGSLRYARLVSDWFTACRQIIESHRGVINKSTGDGLLAYWVDQSDAKGRTVLLALRDLHQARSRISPPYRCLLHHGHISIGGAARLGEESLNGRDLHYLFRCEQALDRTLDQAVTEAAAQRLQRYCPMTPLGQVMIKSFADAASLYVPNLDNL